MENTRKVLTITATRMAVSLVATMGTLGVVPWRVCASHYRERLPVSAFLYLYPRLNSYGTGNTRANFPSAGRNCVPRSLARSLAYASWPIRSGSRRLAAATWWFPQVASPGIAAPVGLRSRSMPRRTGESEPEMTTFFTINLITGCKLERNDEKDFGISLSNERSFPMEQSLCRDRRKLLPVILLCNDDRSITKEIYNDPMMDRQSRAGNSLVAKASFRSEL